MSVFVDTSALYALLDADDDNHGAAAAEWHRLLDGGLPLRSHSYVVVEASALAQRRMGVDAAETLHRDILPVVSVRFVEPDLHGRAVVSLLTAGRRQVSLVDWTSFELMRDESITEAFAFDEVFVDQGFAVRPA